MTHPPVDQITWRHTWPEVGPDFVAALAGGRIGRIQKAHPDAIERREWVWYLSYRPWSGVPKQGRVHTKREAADAVRASLDAEMRWLAERGRPLMLERADQGTDPRLDWLRPPLVLVIGQDVPWPEGWGLDPDQIKAKSQTKASG